MFTPLQGRDRQRRQTRYTKVYSPLVQLASKGRSLVAVNIATGSPQPHFANNRTDSLFSTPDCSMGRGNKGHRSDGNPRNLSNEIGDVANFPPPKGRSRAFELAGINETDMTDEEYNALMSQINDSMAQTGRQANNTGVDGTLVNLVSPPTTEVTITTSSAGAPIMSTTDSSPQVALPIATIANVPGGSGGGDNVPLDLAVDGVNSFGEDLERQLCEEFSGFMLHASKHWFSKHEQVLQKIGSSMNQEFFNSQLGLPATVSQQPGQQDESPDLNELARRNQREQLREQRCKRRDETIERNRSSYVSVNTTPGRGSNPAQGYAGPTRTPAGTYVPPPRRSGVELEGVPRPPGISFNLQNRNYTEGIFSAADADWRARYGRDSAGGGNMQTGITGSACQFNAACNCDDCLRESSNQELLNIPIPQAGMRAPHVAPNRRPDNLQFVPEGDMFQVRGRMRNSHTFPSQMGFGYSAPHTYSSTPGQQGSLQGFEKMSLKPADVPKYSGRGEGRTPYDFLVELERMQQIYGLSSYTLLSRVIPIALTGDAFDWYDKEMEWDPFRDWDEFKIRFRDQFQPHDYFKRLAMELEMRYQAPEETLSYFLRVIAGFHDRLGRTSDRAVIQRVCDQMHPAYKRHINNPRSYGSLAEFSQAAGAADKFVLAEKQYQPPRPVYSVEPALSYKPVKGFSEGRSEVTANESSNLHTGSKPGDFVRESRPVARTFEPRITLPEVTTRSSQSGERRPAVASPAPRGRSPSPARHPIECFNCKGNHRVRDCPTRQEETKVPLNFQGLGFPRQ